MATHKLISVKDGGYFYRFYPNLPEHRESDSDNTDLLLFESTIPKTKKNKNQFFFLYGKFQSKHQGKHDLIIQLEQHGKILLSDTYTQTLEQRHLSSTLIIRVDALIFHYPFVKYRIYSITTETITDITIDEQTP